MDAPTNYAKSNVRSGNVNLGDGLQWASRAAHAGADRRRAGHTIGGASDADAEFAADARSGDGNAAANSSVAHEGTDNHADAGHRAGD